MNDKIKIGIQIFHDDELSSLTDLISSSNIQFYTWRAHQFSQTELESCDILILFARRHWKYIKFKKPYFLILADYVSNQKAINLSKNRKFTLLGYRYTNNSLFKGFLCGSEELFQTIKNANIKGIFYPKKYPFSELFKSYQEKMISNFTDIVTLINDYKRTASKRKWSKPANSYNVFIIISKNVKKFNFIHYGSPYNQKSFIESNIIQLNARYTIHIKYWGHVCNAVVKSLALGTPVIMDEETFKKGRYKSYIKNGKNALVFKTNEEIINYLNGENEQSTWIKLKQVCKNEASLWHFPYSSDQKNEFLQMLYKSI